MFWFGRGFIGRAGGAAVDTLGGRFTVFASAGARSRDGSSKLGVGGLVVFEKFVGDEFNSFGEKFDVGGDVAVTISGINFAFDADDVVDLEFAAAFGENRWKNDKLSFAGFVFDFDEGHFVAFFGENGADVGNDAADGDEFVVVLS